MGRLVGRLALCVLLVAAGLALVRTAATAAGATRSDAVVLSAAPSASSTISSPQHAAATVPALAALLVLAAVGLAVAVVRRPSPAPWWAPARGRAPPLVAR